VCGRFTNRLTWPEIVKLYRLPLDLPARNLPARYNIKGDSPNLVACTTGKSAALLAGDSQAP
jgi:hypothetical protein